MPTAASLSKTPSIAIASRTLTALKALEAAGAFAGQQIAIAPIKTGGAGAVESDPLLSKNIRFLFKPNSAQLDISNTENLKNLAALKRLLQVSPGSTILLRGHVDNSRVEDFRKQGGEPFVRQMAMKAIDFSKQRANEIKRLLMEREKIDAARLDVVGTRLGGAARYGHGAEPARRGAVVHAGMIGSARSFFARSALKCADLSALCGGEMR